MIFHWVWKKTGFPYLDAPKTETKSTTMPKKKGKVSSEKSKRRKKR
jgi:hypothetical protein